MKEINKNTSFIILSTFKCMCLFLFHILFFLDITTLSKTIDQYFPWSEKYIHVNISVQINDFTHQKFYVQSIFSKTLKIKTEFMIYPVSGSKYRLGGIYDSSMFLLGSLNTDHTSLLQVLQMVDSGGIDLPRQ